MYEDRKKLYKKLEESRCTKVIVYITGDRPGLETRISPEALNYFVNHLDTLGVIEKISLYIYTTGGDTLAGWSIVNLIRQYCDNLEVIVPSKCLSTGTLMCLGANNIVMTKQSTLGPIDPSITTALNPIIESASPTARYPVSVEAIKGFIELAKNELGIKDDANLTKILLQLSDKVHPLVLGQVYRTRSQIKMLAERLLKNQIQDKDKKKSIISFLCSESGSHDYTIHRREAKDNLGLNIEKPDDTLYAIIKDIYNDIHSELELTSTYNINQTLGVKSTHAYNFTRALIESIGGGADCFISEGTLERVVIQAGQEAIKDNRLFEGWRHKST